MSKPELPPLPEPDGVLVVGTQALRAFVAATVEAYALAYGAACADAEREACAQIALDMDYSPDMAIADAIRARGAATSSNTREHT